MSLADAGHLSNIDSLFAQLKGVFLDYRTNRPADGPQPAQQIVHAFGSWPFSQGRSNRWSG
jgi:hypothetical protein